MVELIIAAAALASVALALVDAAERRVGAMSATGRPPARPEQGQVQFIILASDGLHVARDAEETLARMTAPFSDLYAAGQDVITQLRLVSER